LVERWTVVETRKVVDEQKDKLIPFCCHRLRKTEFYATGEQNIRIFARAKLRQRSLLGAMTH
jgi:hypothetical protein